MGDSSRLNMTLMWYSIYNQALRSISTGTSEMDSAMSPCHLSPHLLWLLRVSEVLFSLEPGVLMLL